MKRMDIFCASQASTSICLSMEQGSTSSPSTNQLLGGDGGGRAIDRYNPIIKDSRRIPCSTPQPPISPKPQQKRKKNKNEKIPKILFNEDDNKTKKKDHDVDVVVKNGGVKKSWSCTRPSSFISPPGSTRYLLSDRLVFKSLSDLGSEPPQKLVLEETTPNKSLEVIVFKDLPDFDSNPNLSKEENTSSLYKDEVIKESKDEKSPPPSSDQVVVLRVSLHCRGCEKKMRKHLSKMEGVTSFEVDFMAKKVTVTGKVTPLEVLSSISKVKNAQLWPPTLSTGSTPVMVVNSLSNSGFKNENILRGAA